MKLHSPIDEASAVASIGMAVEISHHATTTSRKASARPRIFCICGQEHAGHSATYENLLADTPLGKALIGMRAGQIVTVDSENGRAQYEIRKVFRPKTKP
jgi:transcription elongation GreA/GreB family factor